MGQALLEGQGKWVRPEKINKKAEDRVLLLYFKKKKSGE